MPSHGTDTALQGAPPSFSSGDILFLNARIIDGSGGPSYVSTVHVSSTKNQVVSVSPALADDKVVNLAKTAGARVINAQGFALSPGFIDMHAHSDLSLLHTPLHEAKISQGVTTEVIGQDGIGYAPVSDETLAGIRRQIAGWNGNPQEEGFFSWHTVREYLDTLDSRRTATNPVYLVPQGNLRLLVVGPDNRPATPDEISKMEALLALALEEGAVGMSSGLTYVPGMYAPTSELAALCRVVKRYGGYYCPHTRSYGKGALEAYAEMIELARQTGVALHLTHATMNFAENRGRASELLDLIDDALEEGLDVSLDTYPYLPGSTTLAALLPSWAASGGPDATLARLADQDQLSRIREGVEISGSDGCHGVTIEWATVEISGTSNASLSKYIGRTLEAIAQEEGRDPFDVFCDILVKDGLATTILQHVGDESNVRTIMRHHTHCGGSDGILTSTKPHPRAWGTFPRYLGHYARDLPLGLAPPAPGQTSVDKETVFAGGLEECVHHLTGRPAARLRLRDRGLLREGYRADLVLFDPERVEDAATFANPRQAARGVRAVLVNGVFALDETRMTGAREGKTLRLTKVKEEWIVQ